MTSPTPTISPSLASLGMLRVSRARLNDPTGAIRGARLSGYRIIDPDSAAGRPNISNTDENPSGRATKSRQPGDLFISFH
jgi:hypothetical protein